MAFFSQQYENKDSFHLQSRATRDFNCYNTMKFQVFLHYVLHVRSPEIPTAPNNTAKIVLEKGASQIWGDSKISLPQGLGNCKPFDWNYVDGFFD